MGRERVARVVITFDEGTRSRGLCLQLDMTHRNRTGRWGCWGRRTGRSAAGDGQAGLI